MAAGLMRLQFGPLVRVESAGARPAEEVSALAAFVMDEVGVGMSKVRPKGFEAVIEHGREPFDLIISLSPEAHHRALDLIPVLGKEVEYWPVFDPSLAEGS